MDKLLEELQEKLETQKYYQSATAKQDLSGRMPFCDNCAFKKLDTSRNVFICNLDYYSVHSNQVCAKNYRRNRDESKQESLKSKRKRSNGKS